jgi:endonuclease YncB( thermonuclease family)
MPDLQKDQTYTAAVVQVTDGDTVKVEFDDGEQADVRVLGIDTPETLEFQRFERPAEWVGIHDLPYLAEWADRATAFGRRLLGVDGAGDTDADADADTDADGRPLVTVSFDPVAALRDEFDRLLGYIGRGEVDYNRRMVEAGYARAYGSGFSRHDEFAAAERRARADGRGLWAESDPEGSTTVRNREVREVYVPNAAPVTTTDGRPDDDRVPVYTAPSAFRPDAADTDDTVPLAAVDRAANVVMVGGLVISEEYEQEEGYPVDTASYDNFTFLTNLATRFGDRDGDVLIEGGHGQFTAEHALSSEDAAYYGRYLEGVGRRLEQYNAVTPANLRGYRTVIVTPPTEPYAADEVAALREFSDDGGTVVLLGSAAATDAARENLNSLAARLGSDLQVDDDPVIDPENNLNDDPSVVTTSLFNRAFDLFDPVPTGD